MRTIRFATAALGFLVLTATTGPFTATVVKVKDLAG